MQTHPNQEQISRWLDDDLDTTEVQQLKKHLLDCPDCQEFHQSMHQVHSWLENSAIEMAEPLEGFSQRFEARLAQQQTTAKRTAWVAILALIIGTLLISIILISGVVGVVTMTAATLDVSLVQHSQQAYIETVNNGYAILELMKVFVKACFIVMIHPAFWATIIMAMVATGGWTMLLQQLYRRQTISMSMLV